MNRLRIDELYCTAYNCDRFADMVDTVTGMTYCWLHKTATSIDTWMAVRDAPTDEVVCRECYGEGRVERVAAGWHHADPDAPTYFTDCENCENTGKQPCALCCETAIAISTAGEALCGQCYAEDAMFALSENNAIYCETAAENVA